MGGGKREENRVMVEAEEGRGYRRDMGGGKRVGGGLRVEEVSGGLEGGREAIREEGGRWNGVERGKKKAEGRRRKVGR